MIKRTVGQIAAMCGANYRGERKELPLAGVMTDSRRAGSGELFVPLVGDRFDGHDFALQAAAGGAKAMLWQRGKEIPQELAAAGMPFLLVRDTLAAMQRLAAAYRGELMARVIAITGSNGKTTTKDMTAALLGTHYRVLKTEGNLNNHIGVPMMLLRMDEETEVAVLEMGMSDFGEIELLTKLAQPDVAIITNIGDAHMQQLGSRQGIARAKLEIVGGLGEDGLLLYNGDEPLLAEGLAALAAPAVAADSGCGTPAMGGSGAANAALPPGGAGASAAADGATPHGSAAAGAPSSPGNRGAVLPEGVKLCTFGLGEGNDWSAADIRLEPYGSRFAVLKDGAASSLGNVHIPVPGRHNISNALAAIAVARFFGVPAARIAEGFASLKLTSMRTQPSRAFNGAVILNDAYNANPTAARAAVDLAAGLEGFRRRWLVLGDMLELGPEEAAMHAGLGQYITSGKAEAVLTYGPLSVHTHEAVRQALPEADGAGLVRHFDAKEELAAWLRERLAPDDLVLVKGSRGMRMEQIVETLESEG